MALTNGATFILALSILAVEDTKQLLWHSNLAAALSLEAIRGEKDAFDPRIHEARNHPGQIAVAEAIRNLTDGSVRMSQTSQLVELSDERKKSQPDGRSVPRVQDAYSFRCYAQSVGPTHEAIERAEEVLRREINASTDNPLIFRNPDGSFTALSGGNFHGEPLAYVCEQLKLAAQSMANISDRRFYALMDPNLSYGLPADLAGSSELNTGLMIAQYSTAAFVSEGKVLSHPAVADSIPTSTGQEDYVSMGTISARHLRKMVELSFAVIAWEIVAATQGISLTQEYLGEPQLGSGTSAALTTVRNEIDVMDDDRFLRVDHLKALELIRTGKLQQEVAQAMG